ncbi:MAG: hypothetical protein LBD70_07150, partial [Bifidobacteriaceae bacterium]|nr:hypothetical protein [Bifidobacteriaceae bacterium]
MAGAVALAAVGALAAQVAVAPRASAVAYLSGWDGAFVDEQLWLLGSDPTGLSGWDASVPRLVDEPGEITADDFAAEIKPAYVAGERADGYACGGQWDSLAMGKILLRQGDQRVYQLGWDSQTGAAGLVVSETGNCYPLADLTPGPAAEGYFENAVGGAVDSVGGQIILTASAAEPFVASYAGVNNPHMQVLRISDSGRPEKPVFTVAPVAVSSTLTTSGAVLSTAATRAGKTGNLTGTWTLGAGIAADATSSLLDQHKRVYRMARLEKAGATADVWALLRFASPTSTVSSREYSSAGWTYEVVKVFADADAGNVTGLAFVGSDLYTVHDDSTLWRWDTISGANERLAEGVPALTMAASGAVGAIQGAVRNDATGIAGSTMTGGTALAGIEIEFWRERAGQRELMGVTATDSSGYYWVALAAREEPYYLRVRLPGGTSTTAPRSLTYAYGHTLSYLGDTSVEPLCASAAGDYQPLASSIYGCFGARADGLDPVVVTDPVDPDNGANAVVRLNYTTAYSSPAADFRLTYMYTWGDAPRPYPTSLEAGGPYAQPGLVRLGSGEVSGSMRSSAVYNDQASADSGDNGLTYRPATADGSGVWQQLQGAVLTPGGAYQLRAQTIGDLAANATVKAWLTELVGGVAADSFANLVLEGTPDDEGYVYADLRVPLDQPSGRLQSVYLRARASLDPAVTPTSRGRVGAEADAPIQQGEIEDYGIGLASQVVRLRTEMQGFAESSTWAYQAVFAVNNARADWPSTTGGAVYLGRGLTDVLAVVDDPSAPVVVATSKVGYSTQDEGMNDWELDAGRTVCYDSFSGATVASQLDGAELTLAPADSAAGGWSDVTCQLSYRIAADRAKFGFASVSPYPSATLPMPVGGAYRVQALAQGGGGTSLAWVAGVRAALSLVPSGGGATPDGAFFASTGSAAAECVTGQNGYCDELEVSATAAGEYRLTVAAPGDPTNSASVTLYFDEATVARGEIYSSNTGVVLADYGLADSAPGYDGQPDFRTVDVWLWDARGQGVAGQAESLEWELDTSVGAEFCYSRSRKPVVDSVLDVPGEPGHYQALIYSSCAGTFGIWPRHPDLPGPLSVKSGSASAEEYGGEDLAIVSFDVLPVLDPDKSSMTRLYSYYYPVATADFESFEYCEPYGCLQYRVNPRDANDNPIWPLYVDSERLWDEFPDEALVWSKDNPSSSLAKVASGDASSNGWTPRLLVASTAVGEFCPKVDIFDPDGVFVGSLECADTAIFVAGEASETLSQAVVTQTANQPPNHDDPEVSPQDWGRQTITATMRDMSGHPISDRGPVVSAGPRDPYGGDGLYFADDGEFACAGSVDAAGDCPEGVYTLEVYSSLPGNRQLVVDDVHPVAVYSVSLPNGDYPDTSVLWAPFAGAPEAAESTLVVSPSTAEIDPDDPVEEPAGTPLDLPAGEAFAVKV